MKEQLYQELAIAIKTITKHCEKRECDNCELYRPYVGCILNTCPDNYPTITENKITSYTIDS